jgi:diguanylate cyclase (GGDEF)-like protein
MAASTGEMRFMGDEQTEEPAAAAAAALFQTIAALRPGEATHAARRVVIADLLTRDAEPGQRAEVLFASLLADFGRVVLRLPTGEAAERGADVMRSVPGLHRSADAVHHRFERVDGTGVPSGLSGTDIPFGARVTAVADALVQQRRSQPIDWERRIEVMKDGAGTALDSDLASAAFDILHAPGVRAVVDHATIGTALAIIEGAAAPADPVATFGSLLETMDEPERASELLAEATWSRSSFRTVGVHRVQNRMLSPIAVAGDRAERWTPLALTEGMARVTEPTITRSGADVVHVVPIRASGLWGFAWGVSDTERHDVDDIIDLARSIEAAVARGEDREQLDRLAHMDELTGLANRRQLEMVLATVFAAPAAERADTALVMCDVDGLKRVNDTRGHAAGDDVLRAVAVALTAIAENEDALLVRLGGDEFCVLLQSGGILRAHQLSRALSQRVANSAPAGVGLSCGVAYAAHADTASDLLRRADEAQYQAKRHRLGARPGTNGQDRRKRSRS